MRINQADFQLLENLQGRCTFFTWHVAVLKTIFRAYLTRDCNGFY